MFSWCLDYHIFLFWFFGIIYQVSILHNSIEGRYRSVRVADGLITTRCRFIKNASLVAHYSCKENRPLLFKPRLERVFKYCTWSHSLKPLLLFSFFRCFERIFFNVFKRDNFMSTIVPPPLPPHRICKMAAKLSCVSIYLTHQNMIQHGQYIFSIKFMIFVCMCMCLFWGFTAQSTHWGHVERGQFTYPHFY